MKALKKSVAMIVVLAFLIAALLPVSALAAPEEGNIGDDAPSEPTAGTGDQPSEPTQGTDPEPPTADDGTEPPYPQFEELVEGAAITGNFVSHKDTVIPTYTVLTNAPVQVELVAAGTPEVTSEYDVTWTYKWSKQWDDNGILKSEDLAGTETTGNRYTVTRADLNHTGKIYFDCVATAGGTSKPSDLSSSYKLRFEFTTLGTKLIDGNSPTQTEFTVDASNTGSNIRGTMRVKLDDIDFKDAGVTLGPKSAYVTKYNWSTNAPTEKWEKDGTRTYHEGLDGWGSDFAPYQNGIQLKVDKKDVAAGLWQYYCKAEGVGIDSAQDVMTFNVKTTPRLMPVDLNEYHAVANQVYVEYAKKSDGSDDKRQMKLTFRADSDKNWPIAAEWMSDIVPVGADYVWVRDGAPGNPESFADNKPKHEIALNDQSTYKFAWQYQATADKNAPDLHLDRSLNNTTDRWFEATYEAKLEIIVEAPDITDIRISKPGSTIVTGSALPTCDIPLGGDIDLTPVLDNDGDLSKGFTYTWQVAAPDTDNFIDVTDSRKAVKLDYELLDNRRILRIKDANADLKGAKLRLIVANLNNVTDSEDTVIKTKAAEIPVVTITSDPPATMANFRQIVEQQRIKFTADVTNSINPKRLTYQWQQSDTADPDDFKDVTGGDGKKAEWTSPALTRRNNESISRYYFRCIVSNTAELPSVKNKPDIYTVEVLPITGQVRWITPTDDDERSGSKAYMSGTGDEFTVEAETYDKQKVLYQWQVRHASTREAALVATPEAIEGATEGKIKTGRLDAGWHVYSCIGTNSKDDTQSSESPRFILEVLQSETIPIVEVDPQETSIGGEVGGSVRMKVVKAFTISNDPVAYEWQVSTGKNDNFTAVPGGTRPTLTLVDLDAKQNGYKYRCHVYNRNHKDQFYDTRPWTLGVWKTEDVPKIIQQPKDLRLLEASAGASNAKLQTVVEATQKSNFIFTWEKLEEKTDLWVTAEQEPSTLVGSESTTGILNLTGVPEDVGTYRCVIENLGGSPAGARSITNEVTVRIMERNVPVITKEPPIKQYANVGKTAQLQVLADVEPVQNLLYTWQMSPDGGETWRNCTAADGDGYTTNTFTTQTITQEMVGYSLFFRCAVQGQQGGVVTYTRVTQVIPKMPSPELKTVAQTHLSVTTDPRTGERVLMGQTVGSLDDALTPAEIRKFLDISDVEDGVIEITKDGKKMKDDDPVGSDVLITLLDKDQVPLDDITVVVMGDLLGTAQSSLSQLVLLAGTVRGKSQLKGSFARASDHNHNSKIGEVSDLVAQAKIFRGAGGEVPPDETTEPGASAGPDASASPSASASASPSR